jgi:hypothetical protein
LVADDKGLLAMDESTPACNRRFAALGIPQAEEVRRAYRELIVTTPGLSEERWRFRSPAPSSNWLWRFGAARKPTCRRRTKLCITELPATGGAPRRLHRRNGKCG